MMTSCLVNPGGKRLRDGATFVHRGDGAIQPRPHAHHIFSTKRQRMWKPYQKRPSARHKTKHSKNELMITLHNWIPHQRFPTKKTMLICSKHPPIIIYVISLLYFVQNLYDIYIDRSHLCTHLVGSLAWMLEWVIQRLIMANDGCLSVKHTFHCQKIKS